MIFDDTLDVHRKRADRIRTSSTTVSEGRAYIVYSLDRLAASTSAQ
jgi:hypothetical protein